MKTPNGLGSIAKLLKRFKKAREEWELFRSLHQEAFDFANPQRQTFTQRSPGQRKNRHVFDSTAVIGLEQFASKIKGALMPAWQEWLNYTSGSDIPEDEVDRTDKELEDITTKYFQHLDHSNFDTEITPGLNDLGVGTGAIMIEEDSQFLTSGKAFKFTNVPLPECYPERPSSGPIESVWRWQEVIARDIKETWPGAEIPPALEAKIKREPECKVKLLNGVLFNPTDKLYHQVVIYEADKKLMFTQSFKTKRLIVFRWHVVPGETFGRGPIMQVLPDIRTVNKVKQFILENAAIQMSGVYTGVDDGVLNPHTVRIAPGVVIPVGSNAQGNSSLKALERAGDIGIGGLIIQDLQQNIRKALFADPFGELDDPVRTATEQMLRKQEMLESSGASFGRLKSELLEPLAAAGIEILAKLGQVEESLRVDGNTITIKMTSPLAKAEDLEDFQNYQVWRADNATLPEAIQAGSMKLEDMPRWTAKKLGIPMELVRTDEEREKLAADVQQAAQAQLEGGGTPLDN